MLKSNFFKRLLSVAICMLILIAALPAFPITSRAATLSKAPVKDWTGYTPINSLEYLIEKVKEDPYGKFYLTCDLEVYGKQLVPGGSLYDEEYDGWGPIGTGYYEPIDDSGTREGFERALEKYTVLYTYNSADDSYSEIYEYDPTIKAYYFYDAFYGVFDGNGHSIKYLEMVSYNGANGFFGVNYGTIHDLRIYSCELGGYSNTGAICGINYGIITDCCSGGTVYGVGLLGGICGSNFGIIMGCSSSITVSGEFYCGGIAGMNSGYIQNSFNSGDTRATDYAGGIAGLAYYSTITECVSNGYIEAANGTHGTVVGKEEDDGFACNKYRNFIYRSYLTDHRGEKGSADIIKPSDAFASGGGYYYNQPYFYAGKGFDTKHDIYFNSYSEPRAMNAPRQTDFACSAIWDGSAVPRMTKGSGTKADPYVIETAPELAYISKRVAAGDSLEGKYFELGCDIELNDSSIKYWFRNAAEFKPIGNIENPFSGHFDGKGYTIKGLYCNRADSLGAGLFGCISGGSVKNLNVDVYIKGTMFAGGICGSCVDSVISNCHVTGYIRGIAYAGMISGTNYGEIDHCSSSGTAYATALVGGICGDNVGKVTCSSSTARVIGADEYQGGISGDNYGEINDCYTLGDVLGIRYVGGITGENYDGRIENCYAAGKISGWFNAASICGNNTVSGDIDTAGVYNCYYLKDTATHFCGVVQNGMGSSVIGGSSSDKAGKTKGCTSAEMAVEGTFVGFDFDKIWYMDEAGGYPKLSDYVSALLGDVNGDGIVNSIDSNLIKRHLTDSSVEIDQSAADVNEDGAINALDSNLIKRMIAGQS